MRQGGLTMRPIFLGTALGALLATAAMAQDFQIPSGDLDKALDAYMKQSGVALMYLPANVKGVRTKGVEGNLSAESALSRILTGTGFTSHRASTGAIGIFREEQSDAKTDYLGSGSSLVLAQAAAPRAAVETVTVTSSNLGGADVQSIPISITALSQEQLTATQTAGGPDLVKQVPNLTFTKTNFTGYSI